MNLVAFGVIAQIDDFYADSLKNSFLKKIVSKGSLNFQSLQNKPFNSLDINKLPQSKVLHFIYKLIRAIYDSVYFYFCPFLVVIVSFLQLGIRKQ